MNAISASQLQAAAPTAKPWAIAAIASTSGAVFTKYGLNSIRRVWGFLSIAFEESGGLTVFSENLNYSAERLCEVWPSEFPTLNAAAPYAMNPQALANRVYGGRMGNKGPNDGWLFRGRGILQVTGHDNFALLQRLTGLPLLAQPDEAADADNLLACAVALFVQYPGILALCDAEKWSEVWALVGTGRANGRVINLPAHEAALARVQKAIPAFAEPPAAVAKPAVAPSAPAAPQPAQPADIAAAQAKIGQLTDSPQHMSIWQRIVAALEEL